VNRNDYNLIAAVLRSAIDEGKAQPILALHMMEAFMRRGDREPDFRPQDFINRCVREAKRSELPKISPKGVGAPPQEKKAPMQIEDDAAMFSAILAVEFPHLKGRVSCALTVKQPGRFSVGRTGGKVWIRFGGQAMADPVGAVRDAVEGAQEMLRGTTTATQITRR
jgi:hypothetical protein